jgi:hypothetical protein
MSLCHRTVDFASVPMSHAGAYGVLAGVDMLRYDGDNPVDR